MPDKTEAFNLLMEYLQDVLDMETRLMGLRWGLSTVNSRISELQHESERTVIPAEPVRPAEPSKPIAPTNPAETEIMSGRAKNTAIRVAGGVMLVAGVVLGGRGLAGALVIAGIILLIMPHFTNKRLKKESDQWQQKADAKADEDWARIQSDWHKKEARYEQETKDYIENKQTAESRLKELNTELSWLNMRADQITQYISDSEPILKVLYAQDIIHPKYQNITAVASINDYLSTGRTETLKISGADRGAYNLYEDDVKAGRIINAIDVGFTGLGRKVDGVGYKIDSMGRRISDSIGALRDEVGAAMGKLSENQHSLYTAIGESNEILQSISADNASMHGTLLENTKYAKESAENTERSSQYYTDKYGIARSVMGWPY